MLLHLANTLLLWHLLRRLTVPGAWVAAAVFAVHPVHVESVAWIIERKDVLSGMFCLLAASAWVRLAEQPRPRSHLSALAAYAASYHPKARDAQLNLGSELLSRNRLDEALDAYRIAEQQRPTTASPPTAAAWPCTTSAGWTKPLPPAGSQAPPSSRSPAGRHILHRCTDVALHSLTDVFFEFVFGLGLGVAPRILGHLCPIAAFLNTVFVDSHLHCSSPLTVVAYFLARGHPPVRLVRAGRRPTAQRPRVPLGSRL